MNKKRFLAWLMTLVMMIGLMPATALANGEAATPTLNPAPITITETVSDETSVVAVLSKTAQYDEANQEWDVTLGVDAETDLEAPPVEVVLVLDASKSMGNPVSISKDDCPLEEHDHSNSKCTITCGKTESFGYGGHRHDDKCYGCGMEEHSHGYTNCSITRIQKMQAEAKKMISELVDKTEVATETADGTISYSSDLSVAVVQFNANNVAEGYTEKLCGLTQAVTPNEDALHAAIDSIEQHSGTYIETGLEMAKDILANEDGEQNADPRAKKVIVLLSDGQASNEDAAIAKANVIKGSSYKYEIYSIGFEYSDDTLEAIASGPDHYYTTTGGVDLATIFANIVNRLAAMITDPMGIYVDLNGTPGGTAADKGEIKAPEGDDLISWKTDGSIQDDESVTITYSVKLDEAALKELNAGNHIIDLNGDAKFSYSTANSTGTERFPVPKGTASTATLGVSYTLDGRAVGNLATNEAIIVSVQGNPTGNTFATLPQVGDPVDVNADGTTDYYVKAVTGDTVPATPEAQAYNVVVELSEDEPVVTYDVDVNYYYEEATGTPFKEDSFAVNVGESWTVKVGEGSANYNALQTVTNGTVQYAFDPIASGPMTGNAEATVNLVYSEDKIGPNGPDGIPDKYQATVTFKVVNGTWAEGGNADKTQVVTLLYQKADGTYDVKSSETVDAPTGMVPNTGYGNGAWTNVTGGKVTVSANQNVTAIHTFVINKYNVTVKYLIEGTTTELKTAVVKSNIEYGTTYDVNSDVNVTSLTKGSNTYTKVSVDGALTGTVKGDVVVNVYYSLDNWTDNIPDKYQVKVNYVAATGGSVTPASEVITLKDAQGANVTTADATISGATATANANYNFNNWTTTAGVDVSGEDATLGEVTIANAVGGREYTFTANFTQKASYTVTYHANGGTGTMEGATVVAGSSHAVKANEFTKDGYTFAGWKDASGAAVEVGAILTVNADVDLYAQWTPVEYTVTYQYDETAPEGITPPAAVKVAYGDDIHQPRPEADGYTFNGWKLLDGNDQVDVPGKMPAASITLIGSWTKDEDPTINSIDKELSAVDLIPAKVVDGKVYEWWPVGGQGDEITVEAGDVLTYEITLTNKNAEALIVEVEDSLFDAASYISYITNANLINLPTELTAANGKVTVTIPAQKEKWGRVTDGKATITYRYTVTEDDAKAEKVENTAVVRNNNAGENDFVDTVVVPVAPPAPLVNPTVNKTAYVNGKEASENNKAKMGDVITYVITIDNPENEAQNVTVTDSKFAKAQIYNINTDKILAAATGGLLTGKFDLGNLAGDPTPGAWVAAGLSVSEKDVSSGSVTLDVPAATVGSLPEMVIVYTYTVTLEDANNRAVENSVIVDSNDTDEPKTEDNVTVPVVEPTVSQVKKVAVHKAEPGVGDKIQYTVVIENTYSEALTNIVVTDDMFADAENIQVVEVEGLKPARPVSATADGDKITVNIPKQDPVSLGKVLEKAGVDLSELENINIEDVLADLSNIPGMDKVDLGEVSDWINAAGGAADLAMNASIDIPGYTVITYTYTVTDEDVADKEIHNVVEVTGKTDDVTIKTEEELGNDGLEDLYKAAMPETFREAGQLIQYMVVLENDGAAETVTIKDNLLDNAKNVYITEVKGLIPGTAKDVTSEVKTVDEDGTRKGTLEVTVPAEKRIVDMPAVSTSMGNRFPEVVEGMLGVTASMTELDELLADAGIDLGELKEQLSKAQDGIDVPGYIILTYTYEATADDVEAGKIYNLAEANGQKGDATVTYDPFVAPNDGTHNGEFHTMYEKAIVNKVNDVTGGKYDIDDIVSIDVYAGNDAATGRPEIGDNDAQNAIEDIIGEMLNHYTLLTDATEYTKGRDHWYTANAFDVIEEDDVDQIIITLNDGETVVVDEDYLRVVNDIQNVPINNGIDLVGLRDYVTKLGLTDLVNFMEDLELNKVTEIYLKFDVTFVVNGKEIGKLAEIVEYGETVADPEYKGIKTWYTDEECTVEFDFNTEITKDTVLYAKYDEKGVTVEKTLKTAVPEGGFEDGNTVEFKITVTNNSGADAYNLKVVEKPGDGLDGKGFYYEGSKVEPKDLVTPEAPVEPATPAASAETPAAPAAPAAPAETPATPAAPAAPAETPAAPAAPAETPAAPAETPAAPAAPAETPAAPAAPAETPAAPAETPAAPAETPTPVEPTEPATPDVQAVVEEGTTPATEAADKPYLDGGNVVIPFLANGESITLIYKAEIVVSDDSKAEDFWNTVVVKVEDGEDADTSKDVVVKEKEETPVYGDVSVDKELADDQDRKVSRGEWVEYEITVKNPANSGVTLTNILVVEKPDNDAFSKGQFIHVEYNCSNDVQVEHEDYEAEINYLEPGDSVTLIFRAKVADDAPRGENLKNIVVVDADELKDKVKADNDDAYVPKKKPSGGGGSNKKPIVAGDVEEILNTEDHFQYVQGYPDGTVGPERNITRAEATVIFFRLLQDHVRAELLTAENEFPDVNLEDWFNLGVSTMEAGGFVSGYEDGYFRPNGKITRAELATIISNFDDLEPATENKFADVEGHWAEKYVNSAAAKGWISGYDDGLFRPNQYITRAETMSMINRVLNRRVDEDGLHADAKQWRDNVKGQWYYYAVLEATNHHDYQRADVKDMENWTAINPNKVWEN